MTVSTRIGLVDDHNYFRKTVADLISTHLPEFVVTIEATNGSDFISKLRSAKPEDIPGIVIMDINMPVMDGFETAKWLHENNPTIKILALTLSQADVPIIRMLSLGAVGYLRKNTDAPILVSAIVSVKNFGYYYADDNILQHLSSFHNNNAYGTIWDSLNEIEKEFIKQCCSELTYREIATTMKISFGSLDTIREKIYLNFKVKTRIALVICVLKNNLA